MEMHEEMKKKAESEDWDYFAHLARAFQLEIEGREGKSAKLHKELQITRKVIEAYLSSEKGREQFVSPKFLVKLHKTMLKLEGELEEQKHTHNDFMAFLRALVYKLEKEKLAVRKTMEQLHEFGKHKGFGDKL